MKAAAFYIYPIKALLFPVPYRAFAQGSPGFIKQLRVQGYLLGHSSSDK
jgi:hypothetical protein